MDDALEKRIETLERAVTDGDHDLSALATDAQAAERLTTVESQFDDLDDRVTELEAATQALRGYVGNIRAVNRDVEKRADAALAKAESLESAVTTTRREADEPPTDQTDWSRISADETGNPGPDTGTQVPGREQPPGENKSRRDENRGDETGQSTGKAGRWTGGTEKAAEECCQACGQPTANSPPKSVPTGGVTRADGGNVSQEPSRDGFEDVDETGKKTGQRTGSPPSRSSASDGGTLHRIRNLL